MRCELSPGTGSTLDVRSHFLIASTVAVVF